MNEQEVQQVEQVIGHKFTDSNLLKKALTHSSAVTDRLLSNERLEFFGDAVLGMVVSQELFERFPQDFEGDLTKIKSVIVSRRSCAKIAKQMGLSKYLKVGKGMIAGKALVGSLSAGLLEALIAAIYFDGGFEKAAAFILKHFGPMIEKIKSEQNPDNFKSMLQQYAQRKFNVTPIYELLDEQGPDHNKCFEVQAVIAGQRYKSAWGSSKKEAEQKAAYNALIETGLLEEDSSEAEGI